MSIEAIATMMVETEEDTEVDTMGEVVTVEETKGIVVLSISDSG